MCHTKQPEIPRRWRRVAAWAPAVLACIASAAFVLALARRPTTSVDLGYHLAYGQVFLQTGRIVQDDSFITPAVTVAETDEEQLPPGAYFDTEGRYRFPNANWLSQVILALLWSQGRWVAMNVTLIALVVVIAAAQAAILHRLKVPLLWLAPVWLALGLVGHERFLLRPELFAFACLSWQLWLLCGRITWPRVVAFCLVQIAAVNLHSYWLLGAGIAGAFVFDAAVRAAYLRWIRHASPVDGDLRGALIRLAICAAAMVPISMIHPSGPANTIFPFRTLRYLSQHQIQSRTRAEVSAEWREQSLHPWQTIGEFQTPFTARSWDLRSTQALAALLAMAVAAASILAIRRNWALLALLGAFCLTALAMRRNIIIPAIGAAPLIAAAFHYGLTWWRAQPYAKPPWRPVAPIAQLTLAAVAVWWLCSVVSNQFYVGERRALFFGGDASALALPTGPCQWLDENLLSPEPAFVDQNLSSSVLFFSEKITAVPSLTNTWATPPSRMLQLFQLGDGKLDLSTLDQWGLDVAVLQGWSINQQLIRALLADSDWSLVHIETWYVVFARRTEAHAALGEITFDTFDVQRFIDDCRASDPVDAMALGAGAEMLELMGWFAPAVDVWAACTADPNGATFRDAWLHQGNCLLERARLHKISFNNRRSEKLAEGDETRDPAMTAMLDAAFADMLSARECYGRALEISDDFEAARQRLRNVVYEIGQLRSDFPGVGSGR